MPAEPDVLIVGAGPAGLSTGAALAERRIDARILDRDSAIGSRWDRRYDALHLHTIRRFSGLAHRPIPQDRPQYLSKDEYAAYLREYASAFGLDVVLDNTVQAVRPAHGDGEPGWEVLTNADAYRARVVVIATGLYAEPRMPQLAGRDAFAGSVLHAADYDSARDYAGKRVLVVGLGNSGAEIAADLAAHGAGSVVVSVRTPPPVVSREVFGIVPVQLFGIMLSPLGLPRIVDGVSAVLRRLSLGDLTAYGLKPAAWGPFTEQRPGVIDTGFLSQLRRGRVAIRPATERLDSRGAIYDDGDRDDVDAVILATGYRTGLERLLDGALLDASGRPRTASGDAAIAPGLYSVGFTETVRGQLYEINRQSRRVAFEIARRLGSAV